jgi:alcohol dehydrogenase (cytochrome c)
MSLPARWFLPALLLTVSSAWSQTPAPDAAGLQTFRNRCASCHGTTGNGGEFGPNITGRIPLRSDEDLVRLLQNGIPSSGMPAFPDVQGEDRDHLIRFLRTLQPSSGLAPTPITVTLTNGSTLKGTELNHSPVDLQLLDESQKLHLLRKAPSGKYRVVTSTTDWTSYNGHGTGDRYSKLAEITPTNVHTLQPKWIFNLRDTHDLQMTPVVAGGVMYVTSANECYAIDAGSGRQIWHWQRSRTKGITGVAAGGANRGAAVAGDRVFLTTDNAHLVALNRYTGKLLWEATMADWHQNYNGTGAPLPVGDMIVSGIAGGDDGARGFIVAYSQETGKELWRQWTVPARGEPGSETWQGKGIDHPSGATWMAGSYDPETDTLFWPVGNPGPDLYADDRGGDNLYTESVLALEPKTGKMKWYFQFTPHDVHDFDAMEPSALIDTTWQGKPRKLLVQANRNGFLYVLDRTNGQFLFGTAFTPKLTWASGLDAKGHPIPVPNMEPTHEGRLICPWLNGATNWYSTSWNPQTGLYYVQTDDKCGIFTRTDMTFTPGRGYMGGSFTGDPKDPGVRILRAFDIPTGKPAWELPQTGDATSFAGVLSTAGGIVFFGADDGAFSAADAKTGKLLWRFQTSAALHSSPMTYEFDGHQYVVTAAGPDVVAFALPEHTSAH